jgi:hypothetical protein
MSTHARNTLVAELCNRVSICAGIAASLVGTSAALMSFPAAAADPFARGVVTGSFFLGSGSALDQNYTVLGAGIGYNLADGLKLGVTGETWFGNSPKIEKITPDIRYTFMLAQPVKPYVGAFVSRTFYEGLDDRDSYGARAGVYIPFGSRAAFSLGVVYEKISDCNQTTYRNCSQSYPEAGILVSF